MPATLPLTLRALLAALVTSVAATGPAPAGAQAIDDLSTRSAPTTAPVTAPTAAPVPASVPAPAPAPRADSLRAFLITFGPGAAVWERFGHNALWIHDPVAGTDQAYHYGLFDMSDEGFMLNFLQGRMFYLMGEAPAPWMIDAYRRAGRPATVQELRLTSDQIRELQNFFTWNLRPENRVYRYDYFRDNCSTRIRDAIDRVMDGRLRQRLQDQPADMTFRGQAVALTAEDAVLTSAMDLGLGPLADQPITDWDLAFIPMRLRDQLRTFDIQRDGRSLPLVATDQYLPAIGQEGPDLSEPPVDVAPAHRALWHLLLGLLIAATIAAAAHFAYTGLDAPRQKAAARWALALTGSLWGLITGLLGLILLGLWTLTDHEFAWRNENLLQANPLALGLLVLLPLTILTGRARRSTRTLTTTLAALSILGLLLHPLPLTPQANLPIIALALPIHLALAWAVLRTLQGPES